MYCAPSSYFLPEAPHNISFPVSLYLLDTILSHSFVLHFMNGVIAYHAE